MTAYRLRWLADALDLDSKVWTDVELGDADSVGVALTRLTTGDRLAARARGAEAFAVYEMGRWPAVLHIEDLEA